MDYEKKYNEALAWMRELYPGLHGATKEDAEHYFPELRESEDERARKAALEGIEYLERKLGWDAIGDTDILDVKEYLEKQKYDRMKPIYDAKESFESALEKAWNDYHNGYENVDKLEDDYVECAHAKGFREGYLFGIEKQKEQKPNIEICPHSIKSKSYKENGYPIENCDYGLEIALAILEKTLGEVQGYQTDDGLREHQTAIKAVKDAMKGQKPAEWSEEDERMRNQLIYDVEHHKKEGLISAKQNKATKTLYNGIEKCYDEKIAWLKSLRPQPQKLEDWTEEDDKVYNNALDALYYKDLNSKDDVLSALKDLCDLISKKRKVIPPYSQWKPSKEQIVALARATNRCVGVDDAKILLKLLEQLEKLYSL